MINEFNSTLSVCPICNALDFKEYKLGLLQCESCKFVLSPTIWQSQANEQFEDEWFGEDYQAEASFWVRQFELWNNRKTLKRILFAKTAGNKLLEIGVGSGSFLNTARKHGYEVMGVDLSASICRRVDKAYSIKMYQGSLLALEGNQLFDVIVINHVLEHVPQPIEFMDRLFRLLTPGGVVHIAVPNIDCWEAMLSGWTSFEPYHLSYFSPETLKKVVLASGFKIKFNNTHESFSGWFLAVLRTALGVNLLGGAVSRSSNSSVGRASGGRPVIIEHGYRISMVFAGLMLWPLRWIQSKIGRGDEIIYIVNKPLNINII